ncbi:LysR family transcriptional regulator [Ramlibacter sp.]|uniref:LysR family transcriptional regulator n=1 Tax=Ramlibacter sp. TaxID=1917967 RepID=UPI003D0E9B4C
MDLKQLRSFVHVAELGSFAKAAELLDVAQPTLSRQVRALELELKASLFHRNGRGVLLTVLGARFLEQAHGVLHAAEASLQVLQVDERRLTGRVVCGMTPSVSHGMALEYARRFRKRLPDATLSVSSHMSTALHDQIRASRLDFAIVHDATPSSTVEVSHLGKQSLFVVGTRPLGPDRKTVAMSALAKVPLVMPSESYAIRKTLEHAAARAGISLDIRFEVDVMDAFFALVAEGFGHTISTQIATRAMPAGKGLHVQKIVAPALSSRVSLVTSTQRVMTPLQEQAAELAKTTFRDVFRLDRR